MDGTVRDVSVGGLSVQVEMKVDQGDVLSVVLQPNLRDPICVQAIVWHCRRVKQKTSGQVSSRLGLVLSDAPDDFGDLLGIPKVPEAPLREPEASVPPAGAKAKPKSPAKSAAKAATPKAAKPPTGSRTHASTRAARSEPAGLPRPDRYRVRVKMNAGPRSRSILVFARDEEEARGSALAETGVGWSILEIERA